MYLPTKKELGDVINLKASFFHSTWRTVLDYWKVGGYRDQITATTLKEFYDNSSPANKACFHDLFVLLGEKDNHFFIRIDILSYKPNRNYYVNTNCTWMTTKEQLVEHIEPLRTELDLDFDYEVIVYEKGELENKGDDVKFTVLIDTKDLSRLQIMFVCCWIRYCYEFPSSVMLYDAYKLKNDILPEESIFNLFLLPARFGSSRLHFPADQQISAYGFFKSNEELKESIRWCYYLSDIYERINSSEFELELANKVFELSPDELINFNDWLSPELQAERIRVYIKTVPIISRGKVSVSREIIKSYKINWFFNILYRIMGRCQNMLNKLSD